MDSRTYRPVFAGFIGFYVRTTYLSHTIGAHLSSLLQKFQLCQLIDSQIFRGSGSIIDIVATNDRTSVTAYGVQHCHVSPHELTRALFRLSKCRPEPVIRERRDWKGIDLNEFCADIASRYKSPV